MATGRKKGFRVPIGVAVDGRLVRREDAAKGEPYSCPACSSRLVFRAGSIRATHFAHQPTQACHPETAVHEAAKRLVAQAVVDWLTDAGPQPMVEKSCRGCYRTFLDPIAGRPSRAAIEFRLDDGLVADVVLLGDTKVLAVIEIWVAHRVDGAKAARLLVPWIELRGEDVILDAVNWKPVNAGNLRPFWCDHCLARDRSAAELCRRLGIDFDATRYLPAVDTCWKCNKPTPVFAWRRGQLHETERPPAPMPRTIEWRFSKTLGGGYWANTCFHCRTLIGDGFLFMHGDSPFMGREELYASSEEEGGALLDLTPTLERLAAPQRQAPAPSAYRSEVVRCPECRSETRYLTWDGADPPAPRPNTIRQSDLSERLASHGLVATPPNGMWLNHCFHCDAVLDS